MGQRPGVGGMGAGRQKGDRRGGEPKKKRQQPRYKRHVDPVLSGDRGGAQPLYPPRASRRLSATSRAPPANRQAAFTAARSGPIAGRFSPSPSSPAPPRSPRGP